MRSMKLLMLACFVPTYLSTTTCASAQGVPSTPPSSAPAAVAVGAKFLTPFRLTLLGIAAQSLGCMSNLQGHINALNNYLTEIDELSTESENALAKTIEKPEAAGCRQPRIAQTVARCLAPASSSEATRITEEFLLRLQELSAAKAFFRFCPFIGTGSPIWERM
jgi:hypothetical protein